MADVFPPGVQRPRLLEFANACNTRPSALRRDDCGDWAIFGHNGHIYAVPEGFQLVVGTELTSDWQSPRGWTTAKQRLSFAGVTQDGDCEGCLIMSHLPSQAEAVEIRAVLKIPKQFEYSNEVLAKKREQMSKVDALRRGLSAKSPEDDAECR